jgi:hypothetical protein
MDSPDSAASTAITASDAARRKDDERINRFMDRFLILGLCKNGRAPAKCQLDAKR